MNLKNLSDQFVIESADQNRITEREATTVMLHHIKKIDRRKLFAQLGYTSLFDYMLKRLNYSEDQACRRINAMKLLRELPQIEEQINSGALSLSNLNMAQGVFNHQKKSGDSYSTEQKLELLTKIENKPTREAERIFAQMAPKPPQPDRLRAATGDESDLCCRLSNETWAKPQKIKGLLAHSHPNISMNDLLNVMADIVIAKLDPAVPAAPRVKKDRCHAKPVSSEAEPSPTQENRANHGFNQGPSANKTHRTRIRRVIIHAEAASANPNKISVAKARRLVWERDKVCVHCGSGHACQIDHIILQAKGGASTVENMRVLCRSCNQRAAINEFGVVKMEDFLFK